MILPRIGHWPDAVLRGRRQDLKLRDRRWSKELAESMISRRWTEISTRFC